MAESVTVVSGLGPQLGRPLLQHCAEVLYGARSVRVKEDFHGERHTVWLEDTLGDRGLRWRFTVRASELTEPLWQAVLRAFLLHAATEAGKGLGALLGREALPPHEVVAMLRLVRGPDALPPMPGLWPVAPATPKVPEGPPPPPPGVEATASTETLGRLLERVLGKKKAGTPQVGSPEDAEEPSGDEPLEE